MQLGRFTVKLEGVIVQLKGGCCAIGRNMQRIWKGHLVKWKNMQCIWRSSLCNLKGDIEQLAAYGACRATWRRKLCNLAEFGVQLRGACSATWRRLLCKLKESIVQIEGGSWVTSRSLTYDSEGLQCNEKNLTVQLEGGCRATYRWRTLCNFRELIVRLGGDYWATWRRLLCNLMVLVGQLEGAYCIWKEDFVKLERSCCVIGGIM